MKKRKKTNAANLIYMEAGKLLIDIAKYLLTAVIISSLLKDFGNQKIAVYIVSLMLAFLSLTVGLLLIKNKEV